MQKTAKALKWRIQREYWRKRHADALLPRRAKRVLLSLSPCAVRDHSGIHLNVVKRGGDCICLACGKQTFIARPTPNKSMRPRR